MRILLLIIQFPPDVNSTGLLMAQVAEGLREHGHEVTVITAFPHYEKFEVWPEYRGRLARRDTHNGVDVLRLWVYASGAKQRMIHRLLSYLSFNALAAIAGLLSRKPFDVVLCPNGSFFTGIAGSVVAWPRGIPVVYNVQDLYPDVPVRAGQLRNRRAIAALEKIERFMYGAAAHVTVIAPAFRENLLGKGVPAEKVSVIPNFVDTEFIRPLPKDNDFSRRHGLAHKFVISHAGNLGYVYDLETLLDAAALLRDERDIEFLIVGDGVAKGGLERKARALGLPNVRFLPFQPREQLPWLRATSDVQVSLYRRGAASDSLPSKIYEIMASGRPLLASAERDSDVWRLVGETQCGVCVEPESAAQLAEAILALYGDPERREAMALRGRRHAEESYSRQVVVERYHDLFRRLVPGPEVRQLST
jgi:colanic acid biosynthesis glycosyl transferase WcaI